MKVRHGKRCLNRLHYFGNWHTGVRDTGSKSRRKFQQLIDSGALDLWAPLTFYNNPKADVKKEISILRSYNFRRNSMSTLISMSKPLQLPIKYSEASPALRRKARDQYIKQQNGLCAHCGTDLAIVPEELVKQFPINHDLFPQGMSTYPVHLHHCHDTGLTIGAVHSYCNAILWQYLHK